MRLRNVLVPESSAKYFTRNNHKMHLHILKSHFCSKITPGAHGPNLRHVQVPMDLRDQWVTDGYADVKVEVVI